MGTCATRYLAGALAALWLAGAVAACDRAGNRASIPEPIAPPQISRADLFGEPVRHGAQLSPRGDRVAFLAPRDGVSNLWVMSVDAMDEARALTDDRGRGVRGFRWAADNTTLLFTLDEQGDGNERLYAVDANTAATPRALTPAGARAEILAVSAADAGGVLVTLNQRDASWPDLVRVDIASGERTIVHRNTNTAAARGVTQYLVDAAGVLRLGVRPTSDGGAEIWTRAENGRWSRLLEIPAEYALSSRPLAIETGGRSFLMLDSTQRDRAALVRVDMASGVRTVLGESERADVAEAWLDPATSAPEGFAVEYLRREWRAMESEAQADIDFLDRQLTGDFSVVSRSADDARWIVIEEGPATPARSHLYDRTGPSGRRLSLLFRHRPNLEQAPLQPMTPVEIEARDGLTLVSYLTLAVGSDANGDARPEEPTPLVIVPHGGPWARDSYGFNAMHQWLANRGYSVLSVNFRGSTGFGRTHVNAANREWGGRMQEDLLDAMQWAVQNRVAQADRVAIVGESFGGYAALAGAALTADAFRCAASFNGPANLNVFVESAPASQRDGLYLRVGDARTPEGRAALRERSPAPRASQITHPLLLVLGARDSRAPRGEFDQIAQSLRGRAIPLTSIVFPEEGRELARPQNRLSYYAVLEHFLGDCLGGRIEPVGASFEGANMIVFDGAANVPGLTAFARRPAAPPAPVVEPVLEDAAAAPASEEAPE